MRIAILLLPALGAACFTTACSEEKRAPKIAEASSSFDLDDVRPFLDRLAGLVPGTLDDRRLDDLANKIAAQPVDSERTYIYAVVFDGRRTDLKVVVFMDDIDAPDMHFFTHPELARRIDRLIDDYFAELGR